MQNGRIQNDTEEVAAGAVGQRGGIAPRVSLGALTERRVVVADLGLGGVNVRPEKVQGVPLLVQEHLEFPRRGEGARLQRIAVPRHMDGVPFQPLRKAPNQLVERTAVVFDCEGLRGRGAGRDLNLGWRYQGGHRGDRSQWWQGFRARQPTHRQSTKQHELLLHPAHKPMSRGPDPRPNYSNWNA